MKLLRLQRGVVKSVVARWVDPLTGKVQQVSMESLGLGSEEARRAWAIAKSETLRADKAALARGERQVTRTTIRVALERYCASRKAELRATGLASYESAGDEFLEWADRKGIELVEEIKPASLMDFRAAAIARPFQAQAKGRGVGRGTRRSGERKRSPFTVNKQLRSLKTMLNDWRARGLTPHLNGDSIRDALKPLKRPKALPEFLKRREIVQLLEAAMRHDQATFRITRDEHSGLHPVGTTPRYSPVAPLVLAALLSGMRFGELANLRWTDVDFEAGEIRLGTSATKTAHARRITLAETPLLARLLQELRAHRPEGAYVWGQRPYRRDLAESNRRRLRREFGAPKFTWHDLRRTCGTYLTCAPAIYGAASAFLSAKRLGHSVVVAEKHYVGAVSAIDAHARTLEEVMGIVDLAHNVVQAVATAASPAMA